MTVKYSQLVGQSPDIEMQTPDGEEIFAISVPQGTSPETWETNYVKIVRVTGARVVSVSADKTLALTDFNSVQYVSITASPLADIDITIPANASVAFPIGTMIGVTMVDNGGASPANAVRVVPASGVTLNGVAGGSSPDGAQSVSTNYTGLTLHKIATNEWVAI